jgi:hypothetical protein
LGLVGQPKRGQHHSREAYAEAVQRLSPRDRFSHGLDQFIEFAVHNFSFALFIVEFSIFALRRPEIASWRAAVLDWCGAAAGATGPAKLPIEAVLLVDFRAITFALVNALLVARRLRRGCQPEKGRSSNL